MPRFAQVLIDGVTYVAVPHEPVVDLVQVEPGAAPTPEGARALLAGVLGRLSGVEARLRTGFAAVRLLDLPTAPDDQAAGATGDAGPGEDQDPEAEPVWCGPAHLFSFEARVAGTFELTYVGEDPSDAPGGGNSSSSSPP